MNAPLPEVDEIDPRRVRYTLVNPDALLLTVIEAGRLIGVGRTTVYELMRTGKLPSVRVGRLRKIRRRDVDAYVAGLSPEPLSDVSDRRMEVA
jgi:excisionase family DNA binding protein